MRNLKQKIYTAITGRSSLCDGISVSKIDGKLIKSTELWNQYRSFKTSDEKIKLIEILAKSINKNHNLTELCKVEIINAIENKEGYIYADACYKSLSDNDSRNEMDEMRNFYKSH